jgi:hypothetical protein
MREAGDDQELAKSAGGAWRIENFGGREESWLVGRTRAWAGWRRRRSGARPLIDIEYACAMIFQICNRHEAARRRGHAWAWAGRQQAGGGAPRGAASEAGGGGAPSVVEGGRKWGVDHLSPAVVESISRHSSSIG